MDSLQGENNFENVKIARPSRFCMKQLLKDLQTSHAKIKLCTESTQERQRRKSKTKTRRTSTPTRQTEFAPSDKSYKKFEERLEKPLEKSAIRGAEFTDNSMISGHFPISTQERSHTFIMVFPHSFHTFDYERELPKVVEVCVAPPLPMLCYYNQFYYAYCYPVV